MIRDYIILGLIWLGLLVFLACARGPSAYPSDVFQACPNEQAC